MVKFGMMVAAVACLLLMTGCSGNGGFYDGSEGRAYNQSKAQSHNQQVINSGKGTIVNPGFY